MTRVVLLLAGLLMAGAAHAQSALFPSEPVSRADLGPVQSEYLAQLEALPAFDGALLVTPDLGALGAEAVSIALPGGAVTLDTDRRALRPTGDYTWYGAGDSFLTHAVLVVREGQITGTVRADGRLYAVRPLTGGLHAVVHLDEARFVDHDPAFAEVEQSSAMKPLPGALQVRGGPLAAGGAPTIYVLVPYTPQAASQVADIEALVQLAIDETNLQYANSDITAHVALAHTYQTGQNGSGSFGTDLNRLQNPSDGFFDEVHALRDDFGGDVVVLVTRDYGSACGQARTILADDESEAFAAASQSCSTGYYSFGHEIGHLQGARHNPEMDPNTSPFAYGHGKYWQAGSWRTVMSYNCPGGCTRVPHWSNPDVLYDGTPSGDATQRDNARVLDGTAAFIADFRPDPVPVELVGFHAVLDGDAVHLTWDTASETNNAGFEVQRLADGGWAALGFVEGHGTTTEARTYAFTDAAPRGADGAARYRLKQIDFDGAFEYSGTVEVALGLPDAFALAPAYPNPFNPTTTVRFDAPASGDVTVEVLDLLGRRVAVLARGPVEAGHHAVTWDAAGVPSGVYVVRLVAGAAVEAQRVTLLK